MFVIKTIVHKIIPQLFLYLLLNALMVGWFSLYAQNSVVFDSESTSIDLNDKALVYFDENASLILEDAQKLYKKGEFKSSIKDISAYSKSAIWLFVNVENKTLEDVFLELEPSFLNQVSLFKTLNGVLIDSLTVGSVFAFEKRQVKTNNFVFKLSSGEYSYFIRVKSDTYLPFTLKILEKKEFLRKVHFWNLVNGMLFGALILTILYNLLLYFSVRDSVYLYYSILVFFSAIIISYHFGIGVRSIWGVYPVLSKHIVVLYGLVNISAILFVIKILKLAFTMPKFYKVLQIMIALVASIIFVDLLGYVYWSNVLLLFVFGSFYFIVFIVAMFSIKGGDISSQLFFVSWFFSLVAFIIFISHNSIISLSGNGSFDILVYGGYVNVIILSLVVGNKLNIYSTKKEKARFKELSALKERDNIISSQKIKLEEIVKERNKEIIDKNKELLAQQNEIEYQIEKIEQKNIEINDINNKLQSKNEKIEEQNAGLERNRRELEKIVEIRTEELEQERKRAIAADSLKTSFLNNLSREIKTPMNSITGFATLLMNKTISLTQRNEFLQVIIKNVDSLLSLIDDIVTLSRIQAGIVKIKAREIDLIAFMKLVADEYSQKLVDSNNASVQIMIEVPDDDEVFIKSDYQKIWLIYKQLVDNALKFTEKGSITIGFNVKEKSYSENISEPDILQKNIHKIEFFVKDTGEGMSEQDIDKFIMNHNTGAFNYDYKKGGLGLAIVVGFVNLFNGKINVMSEVGKGTDFSIEINAELIT